MSNKWWQEAIIYQIAPKQFMDSNHDGIGDLLGIVSKLDYIEALGVNTLWLNPMFISPQVANGYDISNYYAIDPLFGSEADLHYFIEESHKRGFKIMFDLVLNQTSNQHPWFLEAVSNPENIYRDYYLWGKSQQEGQPPTNWQSLVGGSSWEQDQFSGDYYFHLFDKKMPDLNWQNPEVRHGMLDVASYWIGKGIDGFCLADFTYLQKVDYKQQNELLIKGEIPLSCQNITTINDYLGPFVSQLKELKPDLFILGKTRRDQGGITEQQLTNQWPFCDSFIGQTNVVGNLDSFQEKALKEVIDNQLTMSEKVYPLLSLNNFNHDQLGTNVEPNLKLKWSKLLAVVVYLQRGAPVIFNGEEISVTNQVVVDGKAENTLNSADLISPLSKTSLTNHGPMQWDLVNHKRSLVPFYQQLLRLKKKQLYSKGVCEQLFRNGMIIVYKRQWGEEVAYVIANVGEERQLINLPEDVSDWSVVLSNTTTYQLTATTVKLSTYGVLVIENTRN